MRFLTLFGCVAILLFVSPAMAETLARPVQCGIPTKPDLETDPGIDFCDIYARQLAYRETQKSFREMIEQRRSNYVQPRNEAYKEYREKISAR